MRRRAPWASLVNASASSRKMTLNGHRRGGLSELLDLAADVSTRSSDAFISSRFHDHRTRPPAGQQRWSFQCRGSCEEQGGKFALEAIKAFDHGRCWMSVTVRGRCFSTVLRHDSTHSSSAHEPSLDVGRPSRQVAISVQTSSEFHDVRIRPSTNSCSDPRDVVPHRRRRRPTDEQQRRRTRPQRGPEPPLNSPVQDVGILSTATSSEGADTADIGMGATGEGRLLLEFNLGLTSASTVESATLDLQCSSVALPGDTAFHAARVLPSWNVTDATWAMSDAFESWALVGSTAWTRTEACGSPLARRSNGTFSLNVTALACSRRGTHNLSMVIAATGDALVPTFRSRVQRRSLLLTVASTSTATTSGGTITPDAANGTALVNHAPILQADTTPPSNGWTNAKQFECAGSVCALDGFVVAGEDRELNSIADAKVHHDLDSGALTFPSVAFDNGRFTGEHEASTTVLWGMGKRSCGPPRSDVTVNADGTSTVIRRPWSV